MDELEELPDQIARALDRLDARAERRAGRVDAERVAARVVARLRAEPDVATLSVLGRRFALRAMVRVAASVAILATGGVVAVKLLRHAPEPKQGWLPVVDARAARVLTASRADSLIRAVDQVRVLNGPVPVSSASVEELNAQELRALLQAMQSEEGT
jgi:hypothetical protein